MRPSLALILPVAILVAAPAYAQSMEVSVNGARPSSVGAPANFTGMAIVTPLFGPNTLSNAGGGGVEFAPGARSAWHTHPLTCL
jgi:quercetin dioxygenase-like cupin family protein